MKHFDCSIESCKPKLLLVTRRIEIVELQLSSSSPYQNRSNIVKCYSDRSLKGEKERTEHLPNWGFRGSKKSNLSGPEICPKIGLEKGKLFALGNKKVRIRLAKAANIFRRLFKSKFNCQ